MLYLKEVVHEQKHWHSVDVIFIGYVKASKIQHNVNCTHFLFLSVPEKTEASCLWREKQPWNFSHPGIGNPKLKKKIHRGKEMTLYKKELNTNLGSEKKFWIMCRNASWFKMDLFKKKLDAFGWPGKTRGCCCCNDSSPLHISARRRIWLQSYRPVSSEGGETDWLPVLKGVSRDTLFLQTYA